LLAVGEVARIYKFVLERAPQALDKHIVERTAATIHADRDSALKQWRPELG